MEEIILWTNNDRTLAQISDLVFFADPDYHVETSIGWYSGAYPRQVYNLRSWPYVEALGQYSDELTIGHLNELIKICNDAVSLYKRPNARCKLWKEHGEYFKKVLHDRTTITLDLDNDDVIAMVKKLEDIENIKDKELLELSDICADTCGDYRVDSSIDNPMYYLWTGMWKQVDWAIKDRRKEEESNLGICDDEIATLNVKKESLDIERLKIRGRLLVLANKGELVKNDGSCDGCRYNGDLEGCKSRVDMCKSGEYIFR